MNNKFSMLALCVLLYGCDNAAEKANEIHFSTSAEYPPFEYLHQDSLQGFDIDLGTLLAKKLNKTAVFDNMQFSSVLQAVNSGQDDAAISTITITKTREKNFDFSQPYYYEGIAAVYLNQNPVTDSKQLPGKKIAAQLGSVMDIWLHQHFANDNIADFDSNPQAIEALLGGQVDVVLMDGAQGAVFSQKYPKLSYTLIEQASEGYGIAVKKGSPLKSQLDKALNELIKEGEIARLKYQWLENTSWKD